MSVEEDMIKLVVDLDAKDIVAAGSAMVDAKAKGESFGEALDRLGDRLIGLDAPAGSATAAMTDFERVLKFDALAGDLVALDTVQAKILGAANAAQQASDKAVAAAVEQTRAQRLMREALDDTSAAQSRVITTTRMTSAEASKAGRAFLDSGRIVQDFAQGGVGGILNNIENIAMSARNLPLSFSGVAVAIMSPAGLAGALTLLTTAAWALSPAIKSAYGSITDGSNAIPETADALVRFTTALKDNNKELDALRDKQSLTNTELRTYNGLLANQAGLERDVAQAKKEKAEAEKLRELRPAGEAEKAKDRAANLQAELGDLVDPDQGPNSPVKKDALTGEVAAAMGERLRSALLAQRDTLVKKIGDTPRLQIATRDKRRLKDLNDKITLTSNSPEIHAQAEKVVSSALIGGDDKAIRDILDQIPADSKFRPQLEGQLPENVKADEKAAIADDLQVQAWKDDGKVNRRKRGEKDRADAETNRLKEQARHAQEAEKKKAADKQKAADAETMKLREQARHAATAKRAADLDKQAKADAPGIRRAEKRNDEVFKAVTDHSDIDEAAALQLAELRAQGGVRARNGRVRKMSDEEMQTFVRDTVGRRLAAEYPEMRAMQRSALGSRITGQAKKDVNEAALNASARVNDEVIKTTQAVGGVVSALDARLNQQAMVLQALREQLNRRSSGVQNSMRRGNN